MLYLCTLPVAKLEIPLCFVFGRSHWLHVTQSTDIRNSSAIHGTVALSSCAVAGCHDLFVCLKLEHDKLASYHLFSRQDWTRGDTRLHCWGVVRGTELSTHLHRSEARIIQQNCSDLQLSTSLAVTPALSTQLLLSLALGADSGRTMLPRLWTATQAAPGHSPTV